jgi:hypothetical protein
MYRLLAKMVQDCPTVHIHDIVHVRTYLANVHCKWVQFFAFWSQSTEINTRILKDQNLR